MITAAFVSMMLFNLLAALWNTHYIREDPRLLPYLMVHIFCLVITAGLYLYLYNGAL